MDTPDAATSSTSDGVVAVELAGQGSGATKAVVQASGPTSGTAPQASSGSGRWPMAHATTAEKQSALNKVMVAMFLHVFAWAITIPVLSPLLDDLLDGDTTKAATLLSSLQFCTGGVELVCNLLLGSLTDKYGRHRFFRATLALTGISWLLFAILPTIELLYIAALFRGFTSVATVIGYAMIVDVSPSNEEDDTGVSKNMGKFMAIGAVGLLLGPVIGGIVGEFSTHAAFVCAGVANLTAAAYAHFMVPETLAAPRSFSWAAVMPHRVLSVLFSHSALRQLVLVFFISNMSFGPYQLGALYSDLRFGWGSIEVGLFLGFAGIIAMITQGIISRFALPGWGEVNCMVVGVLCGVLHFMLLGAATSDWMWFVILPVSSLVFMIFPAVRGLMAKQVPKHMQGRLQGAVGSLNTITTAVSPVWSAAVFSWSENLAGIDWPPVAGSFHLLSGLMWYASAACIALSLPVALWIKCTGGDKLIHPNLGRPATPAPEAGSAPAEASLGPCPSPKAVL